MGTRSTIAIYENTKHLVTIYQQFDGYPSGVGLQLAKFIKSGKLVNGLSGGKGLVFNGMGFLAAALIRELKDSPGGTYIVPERQEEEYNYTVRGSTFDECPLTISCKGHESTDPLPPAAFLKWCEEQS